MEDWYEAEGGIVSLHAALVYQTEWAWFSKFVGCDFNSDSESLPVRKYFQARGGKPMGKDHPIAWVNPLSGGRFFYTELGHDVLSMEPPFARQHIVEAIPWAARKIPGAARKKKAKAVEPVAK